MSPVIEYALVATVAAYGLFGIWLSSLRPFAVALNAPSSTLHAPVTLDIDAWSRRDNRAYGYAYAVPPGWIVSAGDPAAVRLGRSIKDIGLAPADGAGILVEVAPLHERREVQNLAAEDFAGSRAALYDVAVDGVGALFAAELERGRIRRQAVYVPMGDAALVIRSAALDPAAFAAFVSTVKFYAPETLTPAP